MVEICIRMLRISFEWFKFGFERLESLWNILNLHLNDSNPFWMVRTWFRMVRIPFKWFEYAFKCFQSRLIGSILHSNSENPDLNLHLNALNLIHLVRICNRMVQILCESFEFASNCYNPIWIDQISIRMLRISFEWFEFGFEWLESFSKTWNMPSNASNLIQVVRICIRKHFEWCEFPIECLKSCLNGSNLHSNG